MSNIWLRLLAGTLQRISTVLLIRVNQCKGHSLKKALPCSGIELAEQLFYGSPNVRNVKLHEMEALEQVNHECRMWFVN